MQADGGGRRDVERLLAAGLHDAHRKPGPGHQGLAHALPLVPHQPGTWPRQPPLVQPVALVRAGGQQRHIQGAQVIGGAAFDQVQAEMCAHARPQHLGRP